MSTVRIVFRLIAVAVFLGGSVALSTPAMAVSQISEGEAPEANIELPGIKLEVPLEILPGGCLSACMPINIHVL